MFVVYTIIISNIRILYIDGRDANSPFFFSQTVSDLFAGEIGVYFIVLPNI